MRFIKKNNNTTLLCKLLIMLMLFQPVASSFAMAALAGPSPRDFPQHESIQPPVDSGAHHHSTLESLGGADQPSAPTGGHHSVNDYSVDDCCATALCCPGVVSNGSLSAVFTTVGQPLDSPVHFQAITLPIEIKPPRPLPIS